MGKPRLSYTHKLVRPEKIDSLLKVIRKIYCVEKPKLIVLGAKYFSESLVNISRGLEDYKRIFTGSTIFEKFASNPRGKFLFDIGAGKGQAVEEINEILRKLKKTKRFRRGKLEGPEGALGIDIMERKGDERKVVAYDIFKSPLKNRVDIITMARVLQYEPRQMELVLKALELLKFGGHLLFNTDFLTVLVPKEKLKEKINIEDFRTTKFSDYLQHQLGPLGFKFKDIGSGALEIQKPTEKEIKYIFGGLEDFKKVFSKVKRNSELLGVAVKKEEKKGFFPFLGSYTIYKRPW